MYQQKEMSKKNLEKTHFLLASLNPLPKRLFQQLTLFAISQLYRGFLPVANDSEDTSETLYQKFSCHSDLLRECVTSSTLLIPQEQLGKAISFIPITSVPDP